MEIVTKIAPIALALIMLGLGLGLISEDFNFSTLDFYQKIFPVIIILFITSLIILFSNYILRLLNQTLIIILQKIFGLILGALSVEFITLGFKGIL